MSNFLVEGEPEEPEGALETGLWCQRCLLPSGIKWPAMTKSGHMVGHFVVCQDCGGILNDNGGVVDETAG